MKEKISLYKSGDDVLMDDLGILGITTVSNIQEKVFKKYFKEISYLDFLS